MIKYKTIVHCKFIFGVYSLFLFFSLATIFYNLKCSPVVASVHPSVNFSAVTAIKFFAKDVTPIKKIFSCPNYNLGSIMPKGTFTVAKTF